MQGNFNPEILKESKEEIASKVLGVLSLMHDSRGFIVNLGHGVTPDVPIDNVQYFVEVVKKGAARSM